jgi:hypothetical protein
MFFQMVVSSTTTPEYFKKTYNKCPKSILQPYSGLGLLKIISKISGNDT